MNDKLRTELKRLNRRAVRLCIEFLIVLLVYKVARLLDVTWTIEEAILTAGFLIAYMLIEVIDVLDEGKTGIIVIRERDYRDEK